ncbi:MAG TPA: amidohydrolase family protein [Actinomycetota bacterium]
MAGDLVVRGALLVDGTGSQPVPDATLVVEDGAVVYAGAAGDAPPPPKHAPVIDAEGRTIIPGLIDCHVHLCFDGEPDFEAEARVPPGRAALKAMRNAVSALNAGITTVRDLGGIGTASLDVVWAQRAGIVQGPRILTAGRMLTITGGHAHYIGVECDTADDLVRGVRQMKKDGADVVKIMATGGVLTASTGATRSTYTVEQIAAAVGEAREAGMRVAAHAIGAEGIVTALRGGVDSIEHACYLTDEAIKLLADGNAWMVPTLSAPFHICHGGPGVPEYAVAKATEITEEHRASVARAHDGGARIAAGTDAGTPFNRHGGLHVELRLMHEAGVPLERVLISATAEAAALLGIDEQVGTLEPGKAADFVLLEGDPLSDVSAYAPEHVVLVARGGRVAVGRLT